MPSKRIFLTIACALLLLFAGTASAEPLNLVLNPYADIFSAGVAVNYVYNSGTGTGVLTADGTALTYTTDGGATYNDILNGSLSITANVDGAGNLLSPAGTLSITGDIGSGVETLVTGNLTAFGFVPGGPDPFEFLYSVTGGALRTWFGGADQVGGAILSQNYISGFTGFDANFSGEGAIGMADAGPVVPEPSSLVLVAVGFVGLFGCAWLKRSLGRRSA